MPQPRLAKMTFLARIRAQLGKFHPTERRLADFILDFPGELAGYTATELASLAGVSNATVSRFIKRLGYASYEAARLHVRAERESGSPLFLATRAAALDHTFAAHYESSLDNLRRTMMRLNEAEIERIAKAVLMARRVWVIGFRSSQAFAAYFRWQLFQIKEDIHLLPSAGDTLGQYLAGIGAQDVVVLFGLRRRPTGLNRMLPLIVNSGAKVLYVTDESVSQAQGVTWHVRCACRSKGPLDDHGSVVAVTHLILSRAMELASPSERDRMQRIESNYAALEEL
jgi:DNA-binding MurR/RpiR family transcriptional regulator